MVQSMKHKRVVFFSFYIIDVKIKTGHFSYNEIPPVCKLTAPFPSSSSLKVVLSIKIVTHPSQKNLLPLRLHFLRLSKLDDCKFLYLNNRNKRCDGALRALFLHQNYSKKYQVRVYVITAIYTQWDILS